MATTILGLDIGGANLKAATPDKAGGGARGEPAGGSPHPTAVSVPFPLWKQPDALPKALADLVAKFPDADELAVTMTGELCDCFETKREGVHAIIKAVRGASVGRRIRIWSTDGEFLDSEQAKANHLKVAAANWHALATFAGSYVPEGRAILVDVGSTTTDVIPILDGVPVPEGKTDYDRLFSRELVYAGVRRTPVCALLPNLVATELFATTLDVYLMLGAIPEDPNDRDTADGRPATRKYAYARLARMYCADTEMVPEENIRILAEGIRGSQSSRMWECRDTVRRRLCAMTSDYEAENEFQRELTRLREAGEWDLSLDEFLAKHHDPVRYIVSGSGEFLAQRVLASEHLNSLSDRLGPDVSACAPAYAVAVLAAERRP